jgi:hypothetical protein
MALTAKVAFKGMARQFVNASSQYLLITTSAPATAVPFWTRDAIVPRSARPELDEQRERKHPGSAAGYR